MKRHLLVVLVLAIFLPSVATLLAAGMGIVEHERAMQLVAHSYVQDLAETVASRLDPGWGISRRFPGQQVVTPSLLTITRLLSWRLSLPGWVAVVDGEGRVLTASPGAESLSHILPGQVPLGRAMEIRDRGNVYTIAVYPVGDVGWYVVAAVSWEQLLGPMLRYGTLWAVMVGVFAIAALLAVWALWRWLISPLKALETEVSRLRWGEDLPAADEPGAVFEIRRLRAVLKHLAQTAIEKAHLMRRYVTDMVRVQEEERGRLAMEIHDGPLQDVTALIQQLHLTKRATTQEEQLRRLSLAEEGAGLVVRELRGLCDELSPPWLDLGLSQALTEMGERFAGHLDVDVSVECDQSVEGVFPAESVLTLFRVAQEAVHNAVRHGEATRIEIRGYRDEKGRHFILDIEDNGKGFSPVSDFTTLRVQGHRGLANMSERMTLSGGQIIVRSAPGEGTRVRCTLPLEDGAGVISASSESALPKLP